MEERLGLVLKGGNQAGSNGMGMEILTAAWRLVVRLSKSTAIPFPRFQDSRHEVVGGCHR